MAEKKNVAFLVGGFSGEFEVSLKSAAYVESQLVSDKYNFFKIVVSKEKWYHPSGKNIIPLNTGDFSLSLDSQRITFDAAFILIHGSPGEDGLLQAYLDLMQIPYPSCDRVSATISFDKKTSNMLVGAAGMPVARSILLRKGDQVTEKAILRRLQLPVFVKPNQGGSSLGTFKVTEESELMKAIAKSFEEGSDVLVEEMISGRELTIGLVKRNGILHTMPITEVRPPEEFFDFKAKYTPGGCEEITPAPISDEMKARIEAYAKKVYELFGCRGIVRVDYIWDENLNEPVFLELNTIPGMTPTSFIPQQLAAMDWSLRDLIEDLLDEILLV